MSSRRLQLVPGYNPFSSVIKNCFNYAAQQTPIQSNTSYIPKPPAFLATDLIKSYFQKGLAQEARSLFDEMPERDVVAWTAMIVGFVSCNKYFSAWNEFRNMLGCEVRPNAYTMSSVLKACKGMKSSSCGALTHGYAFKCGVVGFIYVDNALLDMYSACCATMREACLVFCSLEVKNSVSWTTLISGFTHRGNSRHALQMFRQMLQEEGECNPYSLSIAVRACASTGSQKYGEQVHAIVVKHGCESSLAVMNAILDMYCRCSCMLDANQHFHEMTEKNLITWNTLIAGYERLNSIESLVIFSQMESFGFQPDCNTYTSVIAACANMALLSCGEQLHGDIICRGLDENLALANAVIDMYAKCGNITNAHKIFSELSCRNLVSWTSMMIGYGSHGYGREAVKLFDEMVGSGIKPDRIVFMAVLSACSHTGLVDQGMDYFHSMMDDYNIKPDQEIYGSVVDLLGRAGRVEEAYSLIQSMPFVPDESVWGVLLAACKAHRYPELRKLAAKQVLALRPELVGTYVMLSNIYAAEGKWVEFAEVRKLMKGMAFKKEVGRSWVEVRDQVYSFVAKDKVGPHIECVYGVLDWLFQHMNEAGYAADLDCLIHDLGDGT